MCSLPFPALFFSTALITPYIMNYLCFLLSTPLEFKLEEDNDLSKLLPHGIWAPGTGLARAGVQ